MKDFLRLRRGDAPLIVSIPHAGTAIPAEIEAQLVSPWLARKDTDWWVDDLYDFAAQLGATVLSTGISRTVIDVNRDPSGASLYPGQTTSALCPLATFDGEPLYLANLRPDDGDIAARTERYFAPYHAALAAQIERLQAAHDRVVLYDAHSIRSRVPQLFAGELPQFNIGTNGGMTCDDELTACVERICDAAGRGRVTNGRFRGGWITRHYGEPARGVHAIQMELACRGYLPEPAGALSEHNWPPPYDAAFAAPLRAVLRDVLDACIAFASAPAALRETDT
jgi:N-formylglutamate deformylase